MASIPKKQYGLILKKENAPLSTSAKTAAAFADEEEEKIDTQVMSSENASASTMRIRMQAKREHERAIAEDPSVFQYDEIYDKLQAVRDAKQAEQKTADKEKKPKYIEELLKAHKRRVVEQQLRDERKQEKERAEEGETYKDKEVFVTGAYRKQMEEAQQMSREIAMQDRIDELTAVEKQKFWQAGFHRTMLQDISRDSEAIPSTSKIAADIKTEVIEDMEPSTAAAHAKKLKSLRQRLELEEDVLPTPSATEVKVKTKNKQGASEIKKSIYSDESEEEPSAEETKVELKPGLNVLSRPKKLTKAQLLVRRFTPSDSESDEAEETQARRRRKSSTQEYPITHRKDSSHGERRHRSRSPGKRERKRSMSPARRSKLKEASRRRSKSVEKRREHGHSDRHVKHRNKRHDSPDSKRRKHEEKAYRKRSWSGERESKEKHYRRKDIKSDEGIKSKSEHLEVEEKLAKPKTDKERLQGLKKILKHRNGPQEIAEYRKRYFERKESNFVTLPL